MKYRYQSVNGGGMVAKSHTDVIGSKRDTSPVKVTNDDAVDMDEIYAMFFKCSMCGSEYLTSRDTYCSNCGRVLEWEVDWETV